MNQREINRIVWIVKFGMIGFGYLTLSMFQHTFNPIEFHWLGVLVFFLWTLMWLQAKANKVN